MLSVSCVESWPEGSVGLEEEVVTAAAQAEESPAPRESPAPCCAGALSLDDSLTSLQWLQEFSIAGAPHAALASPQQGALLGRCSPLAHPDAPASPLAADPASMGAPLTPGKPTAAAFSRGHCPGEVDYRSDPRVKPPYSYATLICMAMQASASAKITLSCIYKWITDNFCYFRHADPTWQNSIRHNLSLNKCFIKVPRQKDEPGKGGFWRIDPQYAERLLSGAYKKRRLPPVRINPALQARLRPPVTPDLATPDPSPATPDPSLLSVSPESQRLLREFEEATRAEVGGDPHLTEVVLGGGGRGQKRKQLGGARPAKAPRRSSSPLLSGEEQRELGALKGSFDWDALLDSALNGELSLDEGGPFSPIPPPHHQDDQHDLAVRGTHLSLGPAPPRGEGPLSHAHGGGRRGGGGRGGDADLEDETFLATAFLQGPWAEEEEEDEGPAAKVDFLCSSAVNIEQLFDLGDSLGGDISSRIEALL